MENFYTAYTKVIQNTTFYFVKKFTIFPEFKDMPPVLESLGMHTDFNRACEIASVKDETARKNLFEEVQNQDISAKIIHMNISTDISVAQ